MTATATIEESLGEIVVKVPDPKTGEVWTVQVLNHYNDGISLLVGREREGMAMWIDDPEALRSLGEWFETAANQIEEARRVGDNAGD